MTRALPKGHASIDFQERLSRAEEAIGLLTVELRNLCTSFAGAAEVVSRVKLSDNDRSIMEATVRKVRKSATRLR